MVMMFPGTTIHHPVPAWLCGLVISLPLHTSANTEREWNFRVYLEDREIGYHRFHLTQHGTGSEIVSEARFEVTFMKIPFFRYRHRNVETWNDQCLASISSTTDDVASSIVV